MNRRVAVMSSDGQLADRARIKVRILRLETRSHPRDRASYRFGRDVIRACKHHRSDFHFAGQRGGAYIRVEAEFEVQGIDLFMIIFQMEEHFLIIQKPNRMRRIQVLTGHTLIKYGSLVRALKIPG